MNVDYSSVESIWAFIAALPDRILYENTIIEEKCPDSCWDKEVDHKNMEYLNGDDSILKLDQNHDYYYQIQGQLHCTGRNLRKLIVYTKKTLALIDVSYNEEFVHIMLQKLSNFFNRHPEKALIEHHLNKNYYHSF